MTKKIKVLTYNEDTNILTVSLGNKIHYLKMWRSSSREIFKIDKFVIKLQLHSPLNCTGILGQNYAEVRMLRRLGEWSKYIPKIFCWGGVKSNVNNTYSYIIQEYVNIAHDMDIKPAHHYIVNNFIEKFGCLDLRGREAAHDRFLYNWGVTNDDKLYILDYAL
jgi:hypothetical protein